jgi:hypothetical protein
MTRSHSIPRRRLGPNVWVVRHGRRFSIKEERVAAYLVPPVTQRLAITIARLVARANRSELIVQGRSARIRFRDSHGADSRRARG